MKNEISKQNLNSADKMKNNEENLKKHSDKKMEDHSLLNLEIENSMMNVYHLIHLLRAINLSQDNIIMKNQKNSSHQILTTLNNHSHLNKNLLRRIVRRMVHNQYNMGHFHLHQKEVLETQGHSHNLYHSLIILNSNKNLKMTNWNSNLKLNLKMEISKSSSKNLTLTRMNST